MLVKIYNEKRNGFKYINVKEVSSYPINLGMIKRKNEPSSVNNKHMLVYYWRQKQDDWNLNIVNDKDVYKDEDIRSDYIYYNDWLDIYYHKPNLSNDYHIYIDSEITESVFDEGEVRSLKRICTIEDDSVYKLFLLPRENNCYILNNNGDTQQVI